MYGLFGGPWALGALGPGPAGPLDKTALRRPIITQLGLVVFILRITVSA